MWGGLSDRCIGRAPSSNGVWNFPRKKGGRPSTHEDKFHSKNSSKQVWILLTPRLHSYSWNALASAFFTLRVSVYYLYVFFLRFCKRSAIPHQPDCLRVRYPAYSRLLFSLDTEFASRNSRSTNYLLFTTRFPNVSLDSRNSLMAKGCDVIFYSNINIVVSERV